MEASFFAAVAHRVTCSYPLIALILCKFQPFCFLSLASLCNVVQARQYSFFFFFVRTFFFLRCYVRVGTLRKTRYFVSLEEESVLV